MLGTADTELERMGDHHALEIEVESSVPLMLPIMVTSCLSLELQPKTHPYNLAAFVSHS